MATAFLLIRGLTISDYANYVTFSGIAVLFAGVVGSGVNNALVRYSTEHLQREREKPLVLYSSALGLELLVYFLVAGLCAAFPLPTSALLLGHASLALPVQLGLIGGLGMLVVQFARTIYQAEERFRGYIATIWIVQVLTFAVLAILWRLQYLSFVWAAGAIALIQLSVGIPIVVRGLGGVKIHGFGKSYLDAQPKFRGFLAASGWLMGYFLMLGLLSRMDVLLLLRFKGREELAIYGVALQYYSLALLFLGSIHAVLLPRFSRPSAQDTVAQLLFVKRWLRVSAWLAVPIFIFDLAGKPLFVWLNGASYARSFPIFVILSIGVLLSMMFSPLVNILISRGEFRFLFGLSVLALLLGLAGNILLIPAMGGIGAALVVIATQNIFFQIPMAIRSLRPA